MSRRARWFIVDALDVACTLTHWVTLHRPWLWFLPHCPLGRLSGRLQWRWFE